MEESVNFNCAQGSFCLNTTLTCTAYKQQGEPCDNLANRCQKNLACDASAQSTCQYIGYAMAGEACSYDNQCVSSNLACTNGTCALKAGAICSEQGDCPYGQFCGLDPTNFNNALCFDNLAEGANCTGPKKFPIRNGCQSGLVCAQDMDNQGSFVCIRPFSRTLNQPCADAAAYFLKNDFPQFTCSFDQGLICGINGTCQPLAPTMTSSTNCTAPNGTCNPYSICACSSFGSPTGQCEIGFAIDAECQSSLINIASCAALHNCKDSNLANNPNSCIYRNCQSEMCSSTCTLPTSVYDNSTCGAITSHSLYENNVMSILCKGAGSLASATSPSIIIAMSLLLIATLV
eukprot:gene16876-20066_t